MKKYKIELIVPVTNKNKYAQRLEGFKKHSLQNVKGNSILLSVLVGTEKIDGISEGWPEGIDVRIISSNVNHCSAKVYDYYARYPELNKDIEADWHMRVDDDSFTNFGLLISKLNSLSPLEEIYYLMGGTTEGDISVDVSTAEIFDIPVQRPLAHEIECCIASNKLMKKIYSKENLISFFTERAKIERGYTDISFCIAAQAVGALPTVVPFLTNHPEIFEFLTGQKYHIHWIAPDISDVKYNFLTNRFIDCEFINENLIFGLKKNGKKMIEVESICNRILLPSGNAHPLKEKILWSYNPTTSRLIIFDLNFKPLDEFIIPNCKKIEYTEGRSLIDPNRVPFIRSLTD